MTFFIKTSIKCFNTLRHSTILELLFGFRRESSIEIIEQKARRKWPSTRHLPSRLRRSSAIRRPSRAGKNIYRSNAATRNFHLDSFSHGIDGSESPQSSPLVAHRSGVSAGAGVVLVRRRGGAASSNCRRRAYMGRFVPSHR